MEHIIEKGIFGAVFDAPLYHLVLEGALMLWVFWLLFRKSYNPREQAKLSEKEKDELIAEWVPEPLVKSTPSTARALHPKVVQDKIGKHIRIDSNTCVNMATHNYLGFIGNKSIEEATIKSLKKYGVGSCGPRGFYGTLDVHLELEERLAKFMKCEDAVLYSYGFSTIASAIPAYAKRGDVIFVDEAVNFAIQKGLEASRSKLVFFRHNDTEHLEGFLKEQELEDIKNPKKALVTRRFLIVEGIYLNTGEICPLPELVQLRKKYKLRMFVDEGLSLGVIGETGRGVTEYYGIPLQEIDLICSSLEYAFGTSGGFCLGTSFIIDHQRLSGLGYCFSASLPPLLAQAAITALDQMEQHPELFAELREKSNLVHDVFKDLQHFDLVGHRDSPVKHLFLKKQFEKREEEEEVMCKIVDCCINNGVAFVVPPYLVQSEVSCPRPSIRLATNRQLSEDEINSAAKVLLRVSSEMFASQTQDQ